MQRFARRDGEYRSKRSERGTEPPLHAPGAVPPFCRGAARQHDQGRAKEPVSTRRRPGSPIAATSAWPAPAGWSALRSGGRHEVTPCLVRGARAGWWWRACSWRGDWTLSDPGPGGSRWRPTSTGLTSTTSVCPTRPVDRGAVHRGGGHELAWGRGEGGRPTAAVGAVAIRAEGPNMSHYGCARRPIRTGKFVACCAATCWSSSSL